MERTHHQISRRCLSTASVAFCWSCWPLWRRCPVFSATRRRGPHPIRTTAERDGWDATVAPPRGGENCLAQERPGQRRRRYAPWCSAVTPFPAGHRVRRSPPAAAAPAAADDAVAAWGCATTPDAGISTFYGKLTPGAAFEPSRHTPLPLSPRRYPVLRRPCVASWCSLTPPPTAPRTVVSSPRFFLLSQSASLATSPATETGRPPRTGPPAMGPRRSWCTGPRFSSSPTPAESRGALRPTDGGGNKDNGKGQVCYGPHRQTNSITEVAEPPATRIPALYPLLSSPWTGEIPVCPKVWPAAVGGGGPARPTAAAIRPHRTRPARHEGGAAAAAGMRCLP